MALIRDFRVGALLVMMAGDLANRGAVRPDPRPVLVDVFELIAEADDAFLSQE